MLSQSPKGNMFLKDQANHFLFMGLWNIYYVFHFGEEKKKLQFSFFLFTTK